MPRNNASGYEHPLCASRNFIRPQYLPETAKISHKTMAYPTSYENYHGITMIYVQDGCGEIKINNQAMPLSRGRCYLIHLYAFFCIEPSKGTVLDIYQCSIPCTTYHFMLTIPGADFKYVDWTDGFCMCHFHEDQQETVLTLLNKMEVYTRPQLQSMLLFEFFGRFNRCLLLNKKI